MTQQTALEWLCSQIYTIQVEIEAGNTHLKNKIDQAKEIEKQQIKDAWENGFREFYDGSSTPEEYYNKTFKLEINERTN